MKSHIYLVIIFLTMSIFDLNAYDVIGQPDSSSDDILISEMNCQPANIPYKEDFENGFDSCWNRDDASTSFISSDCRENLGSFLQLNGGVHTTTTQTIDVSSESSIDVSWDIFTGCNDAAESGEDLIIDYWDGTAWQNMITYDPANLGDTWSPETFTITNGLTSDFKVRFVRPSGTGSGPNADDISIDNFEVIATPDCSSAALPYQEDFESGELNACWDVSNSFQSNISSNCGTNAGSFLRMRGGVHQIKTREIDVSNTCANSVDVRFELFNGCGEPAEVGENLEVHYWNGSSWQLIVNYDPVELPTGWSEHSHTITNGLTSSFKLKFERPSGNGSGFKVDDISIDDLQVIETPETIPYVEDFESGIDSCWERDDVSTSFIASNCGENTGSFLQLNGGFHSTTTEKIDVSSASSIDVSWEIFNGCNEPADAGENLEVDYWNGSSWQNIVNYNPATDLEEKWEFKRYTITSGTTSDFKLRFTRPDNTGSGVNADDISLDNVKVISTPDCNFPLNLEVTTITSTTVNFKWDAEVSASEGYEYILMASGVSPDLSSSIDSGFNSSALPVNSLTNANFTQLTPNTSYDIHVRSKCGTNEFSEWSKKESFETGCPATALPYIEDFESGFDTCWSRTDSNQSFVASNCSNSNGDYLQFKGGFHTTETKTLDVSNLDEIEISFSIFNGCDEPAEAGENLVIEYWNDSEWQNLDTLDPINLSSSWEEKNYTVDASSFNNLKLRFIRPDGTGSGENADDINIDDIEIRESLNNPDFFVENGTCKCPDANFGDFGQVTINGEQKIFTKRSRAQLDALIAADASDPEIPLTCTSGITDMSNLFQNTSFNQDINFWDVSNVTSMLEMFKLSPFNQPLNNWDVSNVTNMEDVFFGTSFDQPINSWDVSNVTNMKGMFTSSLFNQTINNWVVGNVTTMENMFLASSFNQNINDWNVANVTNMKAMFSQALDFNQPLNDWDVSNVVNMSEMFRTAQAFNQPLDHWDFSNATNLNFMFLQAQSFNQDISGWCTPKIYFPPANFSAASPLQDSFKPDWSACNNFYLADNEVTCMCPDAEIGESGIVFINGNAEVFTKRTRTQLDALIAADINDPQIAKTCTSDITDLSNLFKDTDFNQNINSWDVSSVNTMQEMFHGATYFNQPLNKWNVSNVTNTFSMFLQASSFNQPLNNWNVSNVTITAVMFRLASSFNQPLNNWKVTNVTNMGSMFQDTDSFNQALNQWDVSNVTSMNNMFNNAQSFNQDLSGWCVEQINNEPINFSDNSALANANKPSWGALCSNFFVENDTCKCPDANFGDSGQVTINGQQQTYTKRTRAQLDTLIAADINDSQIALTCTSGITDMSNLFEGTDFSQNINSWDVSNVTTMNSMFKDVSISFDQPLDNWNTSNVTDMSYMFHFAYAFNQNINSWDVSNVTTMNSMFYRTAAFDQPLDDWEVSNVTNMENMFQQSAFNQSINNWDVSSVTSMAYMFAFAQSYDQALSDWDVSSLTNADFMFANAFAFDQDLSSWCVEQISSEPTNFSAGSPLVADHKPIWGTCGFYIENNTCKCPHADIGDSGQVTINGQQKTFTKRSRTQLDALIAADINDPQIASTCTSGITDMSRLFYETGQNTNFNQNINSWDVSNVTDMRSMFRNNILFDQPLSNWDVSNVIDMSLMFDKAESFNQPLDNWNVCNVTDMSSMFYNAESFNQPLNNWDVSNVTEMGYMFFDATSFNQDLSNWDVSNVTYMGFMFSGAQSFDKDLSGWCVGQLNFAPSGFSDNSPLSIDHKPSWGNPCEMITWTNNSWNNGLPDGNDSVIIDDNYNQNSLADVKELTVNTGKILNIYDKLKVKVNLENNGQIIFKNNASALGLFDEFNGNMTGSGEVTVERYVPVQTEGTRAFRFLTSAVNSSGSIYDDWQEGGNTPAGFGTHITGDNNGNNGVDQTITGNPSMYTFDNTFTGDQSNAWEPVLDTKANSLQAGKAYRMFIRGDRNYDLSSNPADAPNSNVTLRATGDLATGDQTFNLSNVAGYYSLIGNPYQSIVSMNAVTSTNINTNFYWVWDPNMSARGAYVSVQLPGGTPNMTSSANQYIQPGQSFFVQTLNNGAADMTFTESAKDVNPLPTTLFSDDDQMRLRLTLFTSEAYQNDESEADGLMVHFRPNANNAKDEFDADKLGNPDENLARYENGHFLSIEERSIPTADETLELFINGFTTDDYVLVADLSNWADGQNAYIIDHYSDEQTLLSNGSNVVNFTVDMSIPESMALDRFSIDMEVENFSVNDEELLKSFRIYPNPVENGKISITATKLAGEEVGINLYNIIGQRIHSAENEFDESGNTTLSFNKPSAGVYFIEIDHQENKLRKRIIIK